MYGALTELAPGTVASPTNPAGVVVSPDGKHVYVRTGEGHKIAQYSRNAETGKLTALEPASIEVPHEASGFLISGDGKFVYVASGAGFIHIYSRNAETGLLTESGSVEIAARNIAESQDEKHIYTVMEHETRVFTRNKETGALAEVSKNVLETEHTTRQVLVSPDGKSVYILTEGGAGFLYQFSRNAETGAITALEPWIIETGTGSSREMAISPDGKNLYVCNEGPRTISQYARNESTGKLTPLSTAKVSATNEPEAIMVSPDGANVYASNWSGAVDQFSRPEGGELSKLTPATVTAEPRPWGLACSPDGKDVYIACRFSSVVEQYSRSLEPSPGFISGTSAGQGANSIELTRPGPEPIEPGESAGKGSNSIAVKIPVFIKPNESVGKSSNTLGEFGIRSKWRLKALTPEELATGKHPNDVVVSPDGKFVYLACTDEEKSIIVYKRNTETGVLTQQEVIKSTHQTEFLTITPDGKNIYAMYFQHILTYSRDTETGALTLKGEPIALGAVDWPTGIITSPDGKDVYACDFSKLNHLARNEATGELTLSGTTYAIKKGENVRGGLCVSPDGKHIYVLAQPTKFGEHGEVNQYSRNAETGELTALEPAKVLVEGSPRAITVTPDGKAVYVATVEEKFINALTRDTETGVLTFVSAFTPPYEPFRILAADNQTVYVTNEFEGGIESTGVVTEYHRDTAANGLSPAVKFAAAKMRHAHAIAMSPDGKSVYVTRNQEKDGVHPSYGEWGIVELSRAEVSTPEFLMEANGESTASLFLGIASVISGESDGLSKDEMILSIPIKFLGMVV